MTSGSPQIVLIQRDCVWRRRASLLRDEHLRSVCTRRSGYKNGLRPSATTNQEAAQNIRNRHLTTGNTHDNVPTTALASVPQRQFPATHKDIQQTNGSQEQQQSCLSGEKKVGYRRH